MPFPSAPNTPTSSGHDNTADLRADMDLLNTEDAPQMGVDAALDEEPETPPVEEEEEPVEGEEGDEEEEEPETEEEPEPEAAEAQTHARPTVRQIKAKYPEFFKDFPDMRHMLFREGEYSRVFPTVDDAKDAQTAATDFNNFRDMLTSGTQQNFEEFLGGVKQAGPEVLTSMVANFLPSLFKTDRDMYFSVTTPIAESLLRNAYKNAMSSGNENLKNAALHVAQWAFGDVGYATGEKVSPELKPQEVARDPKLEQEKKDFYSLRYNETQSFVQNTSRNKLVSEIRQGLDPNNVFKPFTQNLLVKQVMEEVGAAMEADTRHMAVMNSLWKQAYKAGFAGDWKDRILSTYLSRARQLMPAVRARIRASATQDEQQGAVRLERVASRSIDRKEVHGSQNTNRQTQNGRPPAAREIDWGHTSDMDILNDRPTLKTRN